MSEVKSLSGVEIKSEAEGRVIARFATYDEEDHHEDITRKGAFDDGAQVVVSSYNHTSWGGALPVGKGVIRDGGGFAYADLQFFMDTQAGRDTFQTVKQLGSLQQWSYGFDVKEATRESVDDGEGGKKSVRVLKKVKVHEVSPVLLGAGKSTATLAVKDGMLTMDKLAAAGYSVDDIIELLEEKAKKPKPKPGEKDDEYKKPKPGDKKPSSEEEDEEEEEDDEKPKPKPKPGSGKKPSGRGKMRMSDQTDEVITSLSELADRAEEIVALRKSSGKSGVSEVLEEQFYELLKQADRIFALCPQDDDGYFIEPETKNDDEDRSELERIYLSNLSEEI